MTPPPGTGPAGSLGTMNPHTGPRPGAQTGPHTIPVVEVLPTGPLDMNCLVVHDGTRATVVDPGMGAADRIRRLVSDRGLTVEQVLLTHGHIDHVRDLPEIQEDYGVPAYMHPDDRPWLLRETLDSLGELGQMHATDRMPTPRVPAPVNDGDTLSVAGVDFTAHLMPGHSPGSVMYRGTLGGTTVILGGDVLFRGGVGRTDLPLSDPHAMMDSLRRIPEIFDDADIVYPGHGPATTVGREKKDNGFLRSVV